MSNAYQQNDNFDHANSRNFIKEEQEDNFLNSLDFIKFLIVTRRNLMYILMIFAICLLAAILYLRYSIPVYQSSSVLKLEIESNANILGLTNNQNSESRGKLTGEIELIKSNLVLKEVIDNLPLQVSYYSEGKFKDNEHYPNSIFYVDYKIKDKSIKDQKIHMDIIDRNSYKLSFEKHGKQYSQKCRFDKTYQNKYLSYNITLDESFKEKIDYYNFYFTINSDKALLEQLNENLNVEIINPNAKTIKVSYKDTDEEKAKDIVAMVDSVYLVKGLEHNYKSKEQTLKFLDTLLNKTQKDLRKYENKMENFIRKNKSADIESEFEKTLMQTDKLEAKIKELRMKLSALNDLNLSVKSGKSNLEEIMASLSSLQNANLNQLLTQLNKLYNKKELLKLSHESNTYVIQKVNAKIKNYQKQIIEIIKEQKESLNKKISKLKKEKNSLQQRFQELPSKHTRYKRLMRFYNLYEKFYLRMIERKAEVGIKKAGTVPNFTELSQPTVPSQPIYPKPLMVYGFAGGIAFVISLILLVISYFLHNSIDNIGELEKLSAVPVLGYVPKFKKEKMEISRLITNDNPKSPVSEALRNIRTNLEFLSHENKGSKIITLTSTVSGEGKTFVAINLAGIMALAEQKVIVLDMDLRKPKIHSSFNVNNDKGLSTILINKHNIDECIHHSSQQNLDFITSGPIPPNPSELILKNTFNQLIHELKNRYDIIIMDTPPTGLVTDGILLMKHADVPIYIVRSEFSKKGYEKNINKLYYQNNFKNLTVILNDFDALKSYGYGYKYGYGYGYGYYEKDTDKKLTNRFSGWFSNK